MSDKLNEVLKKLQKTDEPSKRPVKVVEDLEDLEDDTSSEEEGEQKSEEKPVEVEPIKETKTIKTPSPEDLANQEVILLRDDGLFRREHLASLQEITRLLKKLIEGDEKNE